MVQMDEALSVTEREGARWGADRQTQARTDERTDERTNEKDKWVEEGRDVHVH